MKVKALLRLGLMFLWLAFVAGCKGNAENPDMTTTSFGMTEMTDKTSNTSEEIPIDVAITVYVCKSTGAKKYHIKEACRGLSNCKHEIVTMERKSAENRGLELCGWED